MERVQKTLSNSGYCSRRKAEELIKKGLVRVNGKKITLGDQAGPNDKIEIEGELLKREKPVYIIFNKPTGCVTAVTDSRMRTVMHYIKCKERVFPVGRLDKNTSGLLILTNDGTFANQVTHPRYETKKTYLAEIDKPIGPQGIKKLETGIKLEDGKTRPAQVNRIHPEKIEITIHEGKNRIVRRMLEALGYRVLKLERTKIGDLELGKLKPGKYTRTHEPPLEVLSDQAEVEYTKPKKKPKKKVNAKLPKGFAGKMGLDGELKVPKEYLDSALYKKTKEKPNKYGRKGPGKKNLDRNPVSSRKDGQPEYVPPDERDWKYKKVGGRGSERKFYKGKKK